MAQKNKVKELVGRGLNSYHTKSLQQIDRIEKKNKEQNHKISILSNELDNDYLTKTEEGSVISLEHSKEGMVYLDELQGNTLVNYCTDGSKEMTLNGDIDVEGTFVTTTEGVDNGLVDVVCEGNTLVNLIKIDTSEYKTIGHASSNMLALGDASLFRNGIQYTIICEFSDIVGNARVCFNFNSGSSAPDIYVKPTQGLVKHTFTMPTEPTIKTNAQVRAYYFEQENSCKIKNLIILEGDWTNKEIPSYFVGMKSVGQDDKNEHKIEILSQNKNLVSGLEVGGLNSSDGAENGNNGAFTIRNKGYIKVEPNTTYTLSIEDNNTFEGMVFHTYDINKKQIGYNPSSKFTLTTPNNAYYLRFRSFNADATNVNTNLKIQLEKGNIRTSYVPHSINKKEISLNEPLRGLPNGIKDRFVKQGGKWYIERNCQKIQVLSTDIVTSYRQEENILRQTWTIAFYSNKIPKYTQRVGISNLLPHYTLQDINAKGLIGFDAYTEQRETFNYNTLYVSVSWSSTGILETDSEEQKNKKVLNWLVNNNAEFIIGRDIPAYEEITDIELTTYLDTTHISNNSTIPCNMKVKNSGYNAIIKPSTLYTVALDTNKSGTIGMNLGGAKVTTTNNVATITTPATLSDDSLRLYGKGIKGSKVRILEGDKTNWIPSHFEGMKSSFEDKVQSDGTYKMEILSNNKNLLDEENIVAHANITSNNGVMTTINFTNEYGWFRLKLKNTYKLKAGTYYLQFKMRSDGYKGIINEIRFEDIADIKYLKYSERLTNPNCNSDYQIYEFKFVARKDLDINYLFIQGNTTSSKNLQLKDFILSRIETVSYESNKSNKIQFSSIEPLRGVGNYKDKFIFKDNKLMIERNCRQVNMSELNFAGDTSNTMQCLLIHKSKPMAISNIFSNSKNYSSTTKGQMFVQERGNELTYLWIPTDSMSREEFTRFLNEKNATVVYVMSEPTYEEVPFELQKIILEGYENGTLFFDTNIPPTSTVTYAGETPIVKATKLNKTEVLNNTEDINDNIIPYLMDMDYRVVMLQLATEELEGGVSMARLFGGTYEMIKRDILSKRLTREEYGYRLADYYNAGKLTEEQVRELEDLR